MIRVSGKISEIVPEDNATWTQRLFLTIDIDWAHDYILADTIDLVEKADVSCTWFVTHRTPLLERLRANPKFELGIHPNFNWLLAGDYRNGYDVREVVERLLEIVPEAKSVRSHSMMQSSVILEIFAELGLSHDVNCFIPTIVHVETKPWRLWSGMVRVPYHWEDDLTCLYMDRQIIVPGINDTLERNSFCTFDFHPIHIFLNTESIRRYKVAKAFYHDPESLVAYRNPGRGTRTWFIELLDAMKLLE